TAKRPAAAMAGSTTRKKTATKKRKPVRRAPTMADRLRVPRLPELEQQQADVWGIGLVLLAVLFAFVFYFGWDGGKVGSGLAEAKATPVKAPEVEPAVVKQTHVEAPVTEPEDEPLWEPEPEPEAEELPQTEEGVRPHPPVEVVDNEHGVAELTPMGNKRGALT